MMTEMAKWTMGIVLGLSFFTAGCDEKKTAVDTSQPQIGSAPSSPPEALGPATSPTSNASSEQNPTGFNNEHDQKAGRKS